MKIIIFNRYLINSASHNSFYHQTNSRMYVDIYHRAGFLITYCKWVCLSKNRFSALVFFTDIYFFIACTVDYDHPFQGVKLYIRKLIRSSNMVDPLRILLENSCKSPRYNLHPRRKLLSFSSYSIHNFLHTQS